MFKPPDGADWLAQTLSQKRCTNERTAMLWATCITYTASTYTARRFWINIRMEIVREAVVYGVPLAQRKRPMGKIFWRNSLMKTEGRNWYHSIHYDELSAGKCHFPRSIKIFRVFSTFWHCHRVCRRLKITKVYTDERINAEMKSLSILCVGGSLC